MDTLNRRSDKKTETLNAVHDDDLMDVLQELGVQEDFKQHRLKCTFCGTTITEDNLFSLFPDNGTVKFSCNTPECVRQLIAKVETQKFG